LVGWQAHHLAHQLPGVIVWWEEQDCRLCAFESGPGGLGAADGAIAPILLEQLAVVFAAGRA